LGWTLRAIRALLIPLLLMVFALWPTFGLMTPPMRRVAAQAVAPAGAVVPTDVVASGAVVVTPTQDETTVMFPDGITFALAATAPFPVTRVELLYRPVGDETRRMAAPDLPVVPDGAGPSPTVEVAHDVDLRASGLPPGIDLLYQWRLLGDSGEAAETPEGRVAWHDGRFEWETLDGARASVRSYKGNEALRRAVLETTEREIVRLEALYGAALAEPVRVWLYASPDDLAGALRPNSEEWVAGAAYPQYGLILAVLRPGDTEEIDRVIPHEVSHLVLGKATGNPFSEPPAWLDEGLATAQEGGDRGPYLALVREAVDAGELSSLPAIAGAFPFDPGGAQLAYAESLSVVTYIQDRYGEEGIGRLVAAYREPLTDEQAVRQALGVSVADLEAGWRLALADESGAFAGIGATGDGDGLSLEDAALIASGGLIMSLAAVLAVVVGVVALRRARRSSFPEEDDDDSSTDVALPPHPERRTPMVEGDWSG